MMTGALMVPVALVIALVPAMLVLTVVVPTVVGAGLKVATVLRTASAGPTTRMLPFSSA